MGGSLGSEFKHIIMNYGDDTNVSVSTGEGNPSVFVVLPSVFGSV